MTRTEFESLKDGDIIRSEFNGNSYNVVINIVNVDNNNHIIQNIVVATRTITCNNPSEWKLIKPKHNG